MVYTSKTNWVDGEVLKSEDLNRVEQGVGDIFTRLDTSKNTSVTLDTGTNTVTVPKDSLFNLSGITGRTLLNLLGRDGNCETLTGWSFTGGSGALDTANKAYGSNAIKMTLSANAGNVYKSIPVVAGKKYVLVADLKNGTASNAKVYATGVNGTPVTSTSSFQGSYLLFVASSTTNLIMGINVTGASGQYAYIDGVRIYELSDTDYSAALLMNTTGIVTMYPYTEGLSGVFNPYAIRWTNNAKIEVASLLAFQTELLSEPVSGLKSDSIFKSIDGQYYKNTNWRKVTLDGSMAWLLPSDGNRTGYKKIYTTIPSITDQLIALKYDGKILPLAVVTDYGPDKYYVNSGSSILEYSISVTDSGWSDGYTPTTDELKAYFYGYKMYDSGTYTAAQAQSSKTATYSGTGTKQWVALSGTATGSTLPTMQAPGYYPYQLMYQLPNTIIEPVITEGQLMLTEGDNTIEVGTGIVLRESVRPALGTIGINADRAGWNINNPSASNLLAKYKVDRYINVYKNNQKDEWIFFDKSLTTAGAIAQKEYAEYDPNAVYSITYIMMEKYPMVSILGSYAANEKSLLSQMTQLLQQTTRRVSILENKKLEKDLANSISPTMLNSWVSDSSMSLSYQKDSLGIVRIIGIALNGIATNGTVVFKLPSLYRPTQEHHFSSYAYSINGTGFGMCEIIVRVNGDVVIGEGGRSYISFSGINFRSI